LKLNVGCGNDVRYPLFDGVDGWINLDMFPICDDVEYFDINKIPYVFKDDSAVYIFCSHVLEHTNKVDRIIHEFTRILKRDGVLHVKLPVFSNGWKHRGWYHIRTYFYSLYGKPWKAKTTNAHESDLYTNCNYELMFFKKNFKFKGINYIFWLVGSVYNRFISWVFSIFFSEYEWKMRKK